MSDPFIGQIMIWPLSWAPQGWALCNGQILTVAANQALYALIGNTYGGTAPTTFALPNLNGRMPVGVDAAHPLAGTKGDATKTTGTGTLTTTASSTGSGSATIGVANLPAHNHTANIPAGSVTADTKVMVGSGTNGLVPVVAGVSLSGSPAGGTTSAGIYTTTPTAPLALGGVSTTIGGTGAVTVANTGSGTPLPINLAISVPLNNVPLAVNVPALNLNFIIATEGIFPQRP